MDPIEPNAGYLVVVKDGQQWQRLTLVAGDVTIGRADDSGLTLPDAAISRRHAVIRVDAGAITITDLNSTNGTFLDAAPLLPRRPYPLADGSIITFGATRGFQLTYRRGSASVDADHVERNSPENIQSVPDAEDAGAAASAPARPADQRPRLPLASRPSASIPPLVDRTSDYLNDLPILFQESDFLGRFLLIFETLWEPLEQRQDHIDMYLDPRTCPYQFLPWLSGWFGLDMDPAWPEMRRRRVLAQAITLYRWRGTRQGLSDIIEVCTGLAPEIRESPAEPFIFDISVSIPPGSDVEPALIEDLIKAHKPAHAGYRLTVNR